MSGSHQPGVARAFERPVAAPRPFRNVTCLSAGHAREEWFAPPTPCKVVPNSAAYHIRDTRLQRGRLSQST